VDKFDQQILALLRADARLPVSQIAREVNLSRSAVSERVRQLEHCGVIRCSTAGGAANTMSS
jgi:Lrp/AsnC family transcriptional regulator, leucine-responsive regulatory protein